jgi:hypothetical protein
MAWDETPETPAGDKSTNEPAPDFGGAANGKSALDARIEQLKQKEAANKVAFNYEEAEEKASGKKVITVYGDKGGGKTALCYGLADPGDKIVVLSFDHQSKKPLDFAFVKNFKVKVKVLDAIKLLDKSSKEMYLHTSEVTLDYVHFLLQSAKEKDEPDWIVIDGTEIMSGIFEMVMRKRNNLMPYQGISNFNVWKERKQYLDDVHNKCLSIAKKGIIYTMYYDKHELVKDGTVVKSKEIPKWIGSVMTETEVLIKVETDFEEGKKKFYAIVESSKNVFIPEAKYDVTNVQFSKVVKGGGVNG